MTVERTIILPTELQELKSASRALVRAFGGQDAAAKRLGTRQQRISDCTSRNTDAFLRLDEVAILEAETVGMAGHPHVTSVLARALDMEIVPLAHCAASGRDLLKLFAQQSRSNGELADKILEAHDDDIVTIAEAAMIEDAADKVIATAIRIRAEAQMIQREARR